MVKCVTSVKLLNPASARRVMDAWIEASVSATVKVCPHRRRSRSLQKVAVDFLSPVHRADDKKLTWTPNRQCGRSLTLLHRHHCHVSGHALHDRVDCIITCIHIFSSSAASVINKFSVQCSLFSVRALAKSP